MSGTERAGLFICLATKNTLAFALSPAHSTSQLPILQEPFFTANDLAP